MHMRQEGAQTKRMISAFLEASKPRKAESLLFQVEVEIGSRILQHQSYAKYFATTSYLQLEYVVRSFISSHIQLRVGNNATLSS